MGVITNYSPDRAVRFDLPENRLRSLIKRTGWGEPAFPLEAGGNGGGACSRVFVPLKLSYRVISLFSRVRGDTDDTSDTDSKTSLREET
jgi:hypothetical protein